MEKYDNILQSTTGRPKISVSVSNPFPIIGEQVKLSSSSKWVKEHSYTTHDGQEEHTQAIPSLLGQSSVTVDTLAESEAKQLISCVNTVGSKEVAKYLYIIGAKDDPYMDITVSKEIIRNDGETTQIILIGENGYKFSETTSLSLHVYHENQRETPVKSFTMSDFQIQGIDEFHNKAVSPELALADRGIYDIVVVDAIDSKSSDPIKINKEVNKLITVTPKLTPKEEAMIVYLKDADVDGNTIVTDPTSKTIILKKDTSIKGGNYRSRFQLSGVTGTWDDPYIVTIDQDTQLVIEWFSWWGFQFDSCHHVVLDGRGYQNIEKGIKIYDPLNKGTIGIWAQVNGGDESELFEVEVSGAGFAGIVAKTDPTPNNPQFWFDTFKCYRLLLHHNYVHNTGGEGHYLGYYGSGTQTGTNNAGQSVTFRAHHMYDCRIYRCVCKDNGYDSLQWNNAENLEICYNTFINGGFKGDANQSTSFSGSYSGKYYNNLIYGTNGLVKQFGPLGPMYIFNNVFINNKPGCGSLLLLNDVSTPEMNPSGEAVNDIPIIISNNLMVTDAGIAVNARNVVQCRGVQCFDNLFIQNGNLMFGGQSSETNALWAKNSSGNILLNKIGKTEEEVADLIDKTYKMADSANHDARISYDSPLFNAGSGKGFNFDFRGYHNWYKSTYPVGPFMGKYRNSNVVEDFRITSFTINDNADATESGIVTIKFEYYGVAAITQYKIDNNPDLTDAVWRDYSKDESIVYTLTGDKGLKTIHFQLKNELGEVSQIVNSSILWSARKWIIGINGSGGGPSPDGDFSNTFKTINFRMDGQVPLNTVYKLMTTTKERSGTLIRNTSFSDYDSGGITTGDNSGRYADNNMQRCLTTALRVDKTTNDPIKLTLTLNPGKYRIGIYGNSNHRKSDSVIDKITSSFIYTVQGESKPAIRIKNNIEDVVWFEDVITTDGIIEIKGEWDTTGDNSKTQVYGPINVVEIEEV